MRRKLIIIGVIVLAIALGLYFWLGRTKPVTYRFGTVEMGNIVGTVSASGTVNPVILVEVGSQVSGLIKEVYVDYNSEVKKGQLIAQIDPEPFELKVQQARANLDSARSAVITQKINYEGQKIEVERVKLQVDEARRDRDRRQSLVERNFISSAEFDTVETTYQTTLRQYEAAQSQLRLMGSQITSAEATVRQNEAALQIAQTDLSHTRILSPVDGVVVTRSVDAGQTVAASLQAPELFQIAEDLTEMQVETDIDEADVGRVQVGQAATFTVDAFPNRPFSGIVKQIRKSATVNSNVTTYTTLISVANPDQILLPGMTANVKILTEERQNVLMAPNAALRFRPSETDTVIESTPQATNGSQPAGNRGEQLGEKRTQQLRQIVAQFQLSAPAREKADALLNDFQAKAAEAADLTIREQQQRLAEMTEDLSLQLTSLLSEEDLSRFQNMMANIAEGESREKVTYGTLWVLEDGGLRSIRVETGLSDGTNTEITGNGVQPGMHVVVGSATPTRNSNAPQRPPRL